MGQAGKAKVLALYPPHREIDAYLNLYLKLVPAGSSLTA
jgi:hypothetical protein